jgi:hypothetical protein
VLASAGAAAADKITSAPVANKNGLKLLLSLRNKRRQQEYAAFGKLRDHLLRAFLGFGGEIVVRISFFGPGLAGVYHRRPTPSRIFFVSVRMPTHGGSVRAIVREEG